MIRKIFALTVILYAAHLQAQQFGFGCLGLVGGFAGYEIQNYDPKGINGYIAEMNTAYKDSALNKFGDFGSMQGVRLGINFFRQNFGGLIFTVKGYYESLSEKNNTTVQSYAGKSIYTYEVATTNLGVGIDIGVSLTKSISWKVLDGGVAYYDFRFTKSINSISGILVQEQYHPDKLQLGYNIGSGFILYIIENYVSLEGSVGMSVFSVARLKDNAGVFLTTPVTNAIIEKNIESGGLNASIQLNLGFPL